MNKTALGVSFQLEGFERPENIEKFEGGISMKFNAKKIPDSGSSTLLHMKVTLAPEVKGDIIVYANGKVRMSCSPVYGQEKFDQFAVQVQDIAKGSTESVQHVREMDHIRATDLVEYAQTLKTSDEKQRMIAVILSDTANEIMLTSMLRSLKVEGSPLKDGFPEKIGLIEKKGGKVNHKDRILQIREIRNGIAHSGEIPLQKIADQAVAWSVSFVKDGRREG